jgi:hypothetical protein
MSGRSIYILFKTAAKPFVLLLIFVVFNSCYRQFFKTITVSGTQTGEKQKEKVLSKTLGPDKYVVVHYGTTVLHLGNLLIDSTHQTVNGAAGNLNEQHINIRHEANTTLRMRSRDKEAILNETNIYISRFGISDADSNVMTIPYSAIKRIDIHQRHTVMNIGSDILSTLAWSPVIALASIPLICNCPHVSAIGKDTVIFKGTLFPGAIGKTLQRNDDLIMQHVPLSSEGNVHINVINELPEIEFIDRVELHEVTQMPYKTLGSSVDGQLISFNFGDTAFSALAQNNISVGNALNKKDNVYYDFSEQGNDEELNSVYLKFRNRKFAKAPILVINAKQDPWLENLAEFGFSQLGNKFDLWTNKMNKVDPKKYKVNSAAKGISMGVYLKKDGAWVCAGVIDNAGTLDYRLKTLKLHVDSINEEFIEVKLEAAHGFWDIDHVGISDEWSENVETKRLKTLAAMDHNNNDASQAISSADGIYHELKEKGNYIDLRFATPSDPSSYLILKGSGYYNHVRNYTHKPNYRLLNYMRSNALSYHRVSRSFYTQKNATVIK